MIETEVAARELGSGKLVAVAGKKEDKLSVLLERLVRKSCSCGESMEKRLLETELLPWARGMRDSGGAQVFSGTFAARDTVFC